MNLVSLLRWRSDDGPLILSFLSCFDTYIEKQGTAARPTYGSKSFIGLITPFLFVSILSVPSTEVSDFAGCSPVKSYQRFNPPTSSYCPTSGNVQPNLLEETDQRMAHRVPSSEPAEAGFLSAREVGVVAIGGYVSVRTTADVVNLKWPQTDVRPGADKLVSNRKSPAIILPISENVGTKKPVYCR